MLQVLADDEALPRVSHGSFHCEDKIRGDMLAGVEEAQFTCPESQLGDEHCIFWNQAALEEGGKKVTDYPIDTAARIVLYYV